MYLKIIKIYFKQYAQTWHSLCPSNIYVNKNNNKISFIGGMWDHGDSTISMVGFIITFEYAHFT